MRMQKVRPHDGHPTAHRRAGWNRLIEGTKGTKISRFMARGLSRNTRQAARVKGNVPGPVRGKVNGETGGPRIEKGGAMVDIPTTTTKSGNNVVRARTIQTRTRTSQGNERGTVTRRSGGVINYYINTI